MLLVKTRLGPSQIHGIGVFADEAISRGTRIWCFQPGFDVALTELELIALSPSALEQTLKYAYYEKGQYILCSDDARFFNHSTTPNTDDSHPLYTIASRDIAPGEELTSDYRTFDERYAACLHVTRPEPESRVA